MYRQDRGRMEGALSGIIFTLPEFREVHKILDLVSYFKSSKNLTSYWLQQESRKGDVNEIQSIATY